MNPKLVLASGSNIRKKILENAGFQFQVIRPDEQSEPDPVKDEQASTYVARAAKAKTLNVASKHPDCIVLGSDQVVEYEKEILRKVNSFKDARLRLLNLSGKTHHLVGAWCLAKGDRILDQGTSIVDITLHPLSENEIDTYLKTEKPYSSVACYFLEGRGIRLVKKLGGCSFSALGLALLDINQAFRKLDLNFS